MLKPKNGEQNHTRPLAIRVFHWLLAFSVLLSFFVFYEGDEIHRYIGYISLAVFFLRVIFLLITKDKKTKISDHHNLANLTHVSIWIFTFFIGLTGFMLTLDKYWGEDWVESLHERLSQILIALVVVHLAGVLLDAFKKKRATWMFIIK